MDSFDNLLKAFANIEEPKGPILSVEEIKKEKEILNTFIHGESLTIDDLIAILPNKEHINKRIDCIRNELSDDIKYLVFINNDNDSIDLIIIDGNVDADLCIIELRVDSKIGIVLNLCISQEDWDISNKNNPTVCPACEGELLIEDFIGHVTDCDDFGCEIHYDICTFCCQNCGKHYQGETNGSDIRGLIPMGEEKEPDDFFGASPWSFDDSNRGDYHSTFDAFDDLDDLDDLEELIKKREDLIRLVNISGDKKIASLLEDAYFDLHLGIWDKESCEKALKDIYNHLMTLVTARVRSYRKLKKAKDDRVHKLLLNRLSALESEIALNKISQNCNSNPTHNYSSHSIQFCACGEKLVKTSFGHYKCPKCGIIESMPFPKELIEFYKNNELDVDLLLSSDFGYPDSSLILYKIKDTLYFEVTGDDDTNSTYFLPILSRLDNPYTSAACKHYLSKLQIELCKDYEIPAPKCYWDFDDEP